MSNRDAYAAEVQVISRVLNGAPIPDLSADDFNDGRHRVIWPVLQAMAEAGEEITVTSVPAKMNKKDLKAAGGVSHIADIFTEAIAAESAELDAGIVRRSSMARQLKVECQEVIHRLEEGEQAPEVLERLMSRSLELSRMDISKSVDMSSGLRALIKKVEELHKNPRELIGLPTGFKKLDRALNGLRPGTLTVIGARTGVGKTAFALNLARAAIKADHKMMFFSMEMNADDIFIRMLAAEAKVPANDIETGQVVDGDWSKLTLASNRLGDKRSIIDCRSGLSSWQIWSAVQRNRPEIIFVDYVGLMATEKQNQRYLELGKITSSLKGLSMEMNIPVVILSQLNRRTAQTSEEDNIRPTLADLRESGNIEQDADVVILLHRNMLSEEIETAEKTWAFIAKNRRGSTGAIPFRFQMEHQLFNVYDNY
jgi:replicative DNA helicase